MSHPVKLPLFPLGVVLFPGMPLPLHIFEERYKLMIGECLKQNEPFGVVYYTGENFYKIGCSSEIRRVMETFDDGRMNILTEGVRRFSISRIVNDKPYLTGLVEFFDDVDHDDPEMEALSKRAITLYKDAVRLTAIDKDVSIPSMNSKELSFLIAASSGFSLNEKQALLEMRSTNERLKKATSALKRLIDRHQTTKEIEGIISGNGYLHNKTI
ncbi:LON peptidase substrate-binding domain-containing protein [bacterium]|nr:LON peptidase substrate-binding domain-containing protein [bacterium]